MAKVGPWEVCSKSVAFDNPWLTIFDHKVIHPDGSDGEYGVVHFKNAAIGILPFDKNGDIYLVGQHRFPHDKYSWELPEGGGAHDIDLVESAKRELEEETGQKAEFFAPLVAFDISNSVTDERAVCFYAWDLSAGNAAPDASEALALRAVKFPELLAMVMNGEISDSLTMMMTLAAYAQALQGRAPAPISGHILAVR